MNRIWILILFGWLPAASCKTDDKPEALIPPATMEKVLWDVIRADVYTHDFMKKDSSFRDTLFNAGLQKKIFQTYKISHTDFLESYNYYMNHPALMQAILDSIRSKHKTEEADFNVTQPKSIIP